MDAWLNNGLHGIPVSPPSPGHSPGLETGGDRRSAEAPDVISLVLTSPR